MTTPRLFAVRPTGIGTVIHIYSPGYQPGRKTRHPSEVTMCNGPSVNRGNAVPLADALNWAEPHGSCQHCAAHRPDWHWCRVCLGHALDASGLANDTARAIADVQKGQS